MPRLYKIALVLGILAAPAAAFAHPGADVDTADAKLDARLDKLFAKLDVNHDGSLSRAELGAMKQKMLRMKILKAKGAKHFRHARGMRGMRGFRGGRR